MSAAHSLLNLHPSDCWPWLAHCMACDPPCRPGACSRLHAEQVHFMQSRVSVQSCVDGPCSLLGGLSPPVMRAPVLVTSPSALHCNFGAESSVLCPESFSMVCCLV